MIAVILCIYIHICSFSYVHLADAGEIALIIDTKGVPQLAKYRRAIVLEFEYGPLLALQMILRCLSAST